MSGTAKGLRAFLDASPLAALVEVAEAKGSTPREKGAWMLVSPERIFGTIGGGQLEFMAIDRAREMLAAQPSPLRGGLPEGPGGGGSARQDSKRNPAEGGALHLHPHPSATPTPSPQGGGLGAALTLDIPLGPEIGQCCGGRVEVSLKLADEAVRSMLLEEAEAEDARLPHVYVFGGGHVGHALASAFALLPVRVIVVETRADALEGIPESVETRLTPVPEEMVRDAPAGSAFVVLTHDHALDFLIVAEALKCEDAAYVGMIGSKTKKATFKSWYLKTVGGSEADFARLVSPIGGDQVKDKRPAVIAALAAAEIMTALAQPG
ncbi:xanthine dehydrogenase accessory protein XdhC [Allomesorhizobium camelthorni]|uniref:Xanthine dehydrogenase accessory protein XdhC n=1 Tax=Allomesorhizobium camelthorni TaxID=475069 RepID=A0A6G4WFH5_9HYPH|nr:xanthine dehydrogenase accessory protein XdhC [Mesorhizobium camelthorni]NGO52880.1 xanthine dehydrogenase accessory protein XdhC [Mesorhizobium camelthorni]